MSVSGQVRLGWLAPHLLKPLGHSQHLDVAGLVVEVLHQHVHSPVLPLLLDDAPPEVLTLHHAGYLLLSQRLHTHTHS